eukprot:scaffold102525_cov72-Phaeocystis_antarctica.AAC.2
MADKRLSAPHHGLPLGWGAVVPPVCVTRPPAPSPLERQSRISLSAGCSALDRHEFPVRLAGSAD